MKKITLNVKKRTVLGRKTKKLRLENIIPGNVYGRNVSSVTVEMPMSDFLKTYKLAGETGVVELKIDAEAIRPVLIHNVQKHPVSNNPLHIDFYQVDLKSKIKTKVPVEIAGTAAAVVQKLGVLLTLLDEVEVEALPTDLPEKITIDVTKLGGVNEVIKVKDLQLPQGVAMMTDLEAEVVKIGELVTKEAEKLVAAETLAQTENIAGETAVIEAGQTSENNQESKDLASAPKSKPEKKK